MAKPSLRLSTNCIVNGKFIPAGSPVPFATEADLPPNLKGLVATGDEEFYDPSDRNLYFGDPRGRSRARQLLSNVLWQDQVESAELEARKLPAETQAALEDEHTLRIARLKAQAEYNQGLSDAAYEAASKQAAETETEYYVKRGGEWGKVQNARLRPGEPCFVKRPNGQYEVSGYIDANGEPPDSEIYL
jgi:hypothetical protein